MTNASRLRAHLAKCRGLLACAALGPALAQPQEATGPSGTPVADAQAPGNPDTLPLRRDFIFGVKAWNSAWETWITDQRGTGVAVGGSRYQVVQAAHGQSRVSALPFATFRYGYGFLTASLLPKTFYALQDAAAPGGFVVRASRSEADLNLGLFVMDTLSLTAGVKEFRQTYGPESYLWRGPTFGVAGAAPIEVKTNVKTNVRVSVYGNFAVGLMRGYFPPPSPDDPAPRYRADYRLAEFGISLSPARPREWLTQAGISGLSVNIGYRSQFLATKNYKLLVTNPAATPTQNTTTTLNDITRGLTVGIAVLF